MRQKKSPKRLINEIAYVTPKKEKKLKALNDTLYDVEIKEVDKIGKMMNGERSMKTICLSYE